MFISGCIEGWHGRSDILINNVPVNCAVQTEEDNFESQSSVSQTSFSTTEKFDDKDINQLQAQTIVFSFLQCKLNRLQMKNCLVPGIGISANKVKCFFYDCEEDIFLETAELKLQISDDKIISPSTVVFLWLALNYQLFCSGVTDRMKIFKADFFGRVGDHLDKYKNDVAFRIHNNHEQDSKRSDDWWLNLPYETYKQSNLHIEYKEVGSDL